MKLRLLATLTILVLSISRAPVSADSASGSPVAVKTGAIICRLIPVKNVSARVMAWWLDPAHRPEPEEFAIGDKIAAEVKTKSATLKARGDLGLPAGIQTIVPIGSRKSLLVCGTAAGIRTLQRKIRSLDKPRQFFKIHSLLVDVNRADLSLLGVRPGGDWVELVRPPSSNVKKVAAEAGRTKVRVDFGLYDQIETLVNNGSATKLFDRAAIVAADTVCATGCKITGGKPASIDLTDADCRDDNILQAPRSP